MFASGFSEGVSAVNGETGEKVNDKRVISTETELHTVHNILHYLYTNQIIFHSKPGNAPATGPRTVDVHRLYQAADQYLLPTLKEKALAFLYHSCNIQNITSRLFGEFARNHADINIRYRCVFCPRLPSIVRTVEFDEYFDGLEGSDADKSNALFRELVKVSLCYKRFVRLPEMSKHIPPSQEQEDETDNSTDSDYETESEEVESDGDGENKDEENDDDEDEFESSEESSDEEEE